MKWLVITVLSLAFSCSGYHIGQQPVSADHSISIPYIAGDDDGQFTATLIKAIASSGTWIYQPNDADYQLHLELLRARDENIGFQYARDKSGVLQDKIVPSENRLTYTLRFSVTNTKGGPDLIKPTELELSVDYDYEFEELRDDIVSYSLGQLNFIDNARDVAEKPLFQKAAQNIVDFLNNTRFELGRSNAL